MSKMPKFPPEIPEDMPVEYKNAIREIQRLQAELELQERTYAALNKFNDGCLSSLQGKIKENKQLTERVTVLEEALTQILGWRELRDTPYVPIDRIEEIAKKALEDSHE